MLDTDQARKIGRIGAHRLHATHDSREITQAARDAFLRRFEDNADPDGTLPPAERQHRAQHLRRAHMAQLSLPGVAARKRMRAPQGTPTKEVQ